MMDEVRWGILGCGDVTEKKSGPAFNKVEGSRLSAVMRRDAAKAEDYARRHEVPLWFSDADELIACPEVNAVYIATPPGSHCELALKVAAAGKPCYVEKPMARTADECERMVEAFQQADLLLFVAFYRRSHPHFQFIKQLIEKGEMGALRELHYRFTCAAQLNPEAINEWRYQPEFSGGGLFWDLGSHALDLFDYWMGPLERIQGRVRNFSGRGKVEEWATLHFEAGSVSGECSWNFVSSRHEDAINLVFEKGTVDCSCFGPPTLTMTDLQGQQSIREFTLPENVQLHLIENIVSVLREGATPLSTGVSGMRTNRVIDLVAARL